MKKFLYSKFDCLVEQEDGQQFQLSVGKPLELQDNSILKIFPIHNQYLPFVLNIPESEHIKLIKFPNYEILELLSAPSISTPTIFKIKNFRNGTLSLIGSPFTFFIDYNNSEYNYKINENNLKNFSFKETNNVFFLTAEVLENDFVVCFHKKSKKFLELTGNIRITETKITNVSNKNTFARHGELTEYNITEQDFELISKEVVYLGEMPAKVPPFLIHIAFFDAVRLKDYNLAKSYLCEEFANKLNSEHFKQFFGEFDSIKTIKEGGIVKIGLVKDKSKQFATAKLFSLKFSNNKISDIIEE